MFSLILVYDVTRRETFTNISDAWVKEVELYSTNQDCQKILVGNKVDKVSIMVPSLILPPEDRVAFHHKYYFHRLVKLRLQVVTGTESFSNPGCGKDRQYRRGSCSCERAR